jgi:dehydrogenase/reductase SDR family protein 12
VCDISNQRAVKALADGIVASGEHVNILVNNAGCMVHERTVTPEGVEANFATNTLGTWALTESLLPAMREASDPRVVTVSSAGMLTEKLSTSDLEWTPGGKLGKFDGTRQYARGKRHQVALTEHWSRDASNSQVLFVSMHPWMVRHAGGARRVAGILRFFKGKTEDAAGGSRYRRLAVRGAQG